MTHEKAGLGGRLPLIDPRTLTTEQRILYDRLREAMVAWAERVGFQSRTADDRVIGPFNALLFNPEIGAALLDLLLAERRKTALSDRIRQIVILSVAALWRSSYALYAHAAAAQRAGFSDAAVRALAAGLPAPDLNEEERMAQRLTVQLAGEHRIDEGLYRAAARHFGKRGLLDMILLAGCYHLVCSVLNAFSVPAPDAGGAARKDR